MNGLCLAAGKLLIAIPATSFTLAWTHSIEKTRWEEDWRIAGDHLVLDAARVDGSGAGMEPGDGAVLQDGTWHYRPTLPPQRVLAVRHSPYVAGYQLCIAGSCAPLASRLPGIEDNAVIEFTACAIAVPAAPPAPTGNGHA